jgi:hypothetical protein
MRILGPIVLPQALLMASRQAQLRLGCSIGAQLIGDKRLGREAQFPEQFAHELRGRLRVAPPLHKEIENLALVVDRPPEPKLSAPDRNRHLVEMPMPGWPTTSAAKFLANNGPNFNTHRLTVS